MSLFPGFGGAKIPKPEPVKPAEPDPQIAINQKIEDDKRLAKRRGFATIKEENEDALGKIGPGTNTDARRATLIGGQIKLG